VLVIDLDHFKKVNDLYGHAAGDALLVRFGHLLQSLAPPSSCCARLGGDEFAMLVIGDCADPVRLGATNKIKCLVTATAEVSNICPKADCKVRRSSRCRHQSFGIFPGGNLPAGSLQTAEAALDYTAKVTARLAS
jgi:diguanylate cyclase (GGDEF)-like protein